ncbi:C2 calcium-dependent domain-containing protein 4B-like [Choloepus didactylus]|uniref:C2 calcium-dependent domain-containing protein 4B-like n=1 Tax=Choloepus didactylus TaxID=27675 RepID=UPI0018A115A2|nr:C2 calcium-dependent domain-containing protein 4B-like [Choloepus didactylus]XP_037691318.1 C2 calcium-dependent domain-containing protein 4B-like [Choloepus didactylus]
MGLLGKLRASALGSAAPEPAYSNVLTPGRIPKFCIPPRMPAPCTLESSPLADALPRRCAIESDLWLRPENAGRTDWDPRSQAALSLPHLPRARTAYGFCALLESPHTRRKESLFLGDPGTTALLRPPAARRPASAHTYRRGSDVLCVPQGCPRTPGGAPAVTPTATGGHCPPRDAVISRQHGPRLLRAPDQLLGRALWAGRSRGLARSRSVSSGDEDEERGSCSGQPTPSESLPPSLPVPRPERLEAEGTVALGRAGGALRLAAEYCPGSGRLRIRLLCAEGLARGAEGPRALGCRVSLVLQSSGKTRKQRSTVVQRSRNPMFDQDFYFDGLTEDEVRRMAVRVKAKHKGRGLERDRELGQGELLLGSLLLL